MLLARTRERESIAEDGIFWWKEYRLVTVSDKVWLEMRYLCRDGVKVYARLCGRAALFTDPETTWTRWVSGITPEKAIEEALGDTDFFQAQSLDPLHARLVDRVRKQRQLLEQHHRLQEAVQRAQARLAEWQGEQERLFHKRHGHKTGKSFDQARQRTRTRLQPEHERLQAEVTIARDALKSWGDGHATHLSNVCVAVEITRTSGSRPGRSGCLPLPGGETVTPGMSRV
jgi:hypothetical protein